jgi:hypothetical protein
MAIIYSGEKPWVYRKASKARAGTKEPDLEDISRDVGCRDVSLSCLTCPLSFCLEDLPIHLRIKIRAKLKQM